jgi:hypothetical protein
MVVSTPQIQTTTLRHVGNSLIHVLKGVRFSMLYACIGVFIAAAWLATQIGRGTIVQSNTSNNATGTGQTLQMQPNQAEGGQVHMDVTTPNVSNNSNTSINATNEGTSVTVNGDTQTVAPDDTFRQSYTSPDGTTHTDVQVSGGTDSSNSTNGRSIHIHSHSFQSTNEP